MLVFVGIAGIVAFRQLSGSFKCRLARATNLFGGAAAQGCESDAPAVASASSGGTACVGPACTSAGNCFVAGTLVQTRSGARPIESITAGELVLARDEEGGELGWHPVLRTFARPTSALVALTIEDRDGGRESFELTPEHRLQIAGRGWRAAGELEPGSDRLVDSGGDSLALRAASSRATDTLVYNLEVDEAHTYFVGRHEIWAHNACDPPEPAAATPPPPQVTITAPPSHGVSDAVALIGDSAGRVNALTNDPVTGAIGNAATTYADARATMNELAATKAALQQHDVDGVVSGVGGTVAGAAKVGADGLTLAGGLASAAGHPLPEAAASSATVLGDIAGTIGSALETKDAIKGGDVGGAIVSGAATAGSGIQTGVDIAQAAGASVSAALPVVSGGLSGVGSEVAGLKGMHEAWKNRDPAAFVENAAQVVGGALKFGSDVAQAAGAVVPPGIPIAGVVLAGLYSEIEAMRRVPQDWREREYLNLVSDLAIIAGGGVEIASGAMMVAGVGYPPALPIAAGVLAAVALATNPVARALEAEAYHRGEAAFHHEAAKLRRNLAARYDPPRPSGGQAATESARQKIEAARQSAKERVARLMHESDEPSAAAKAEAKLAKEQGREAKVKEAEAKQVAAEQERARAEAAAAAAEARAKDAKESAKDAKEHAKDVSKVAAVFKDLPGAHLGAKVAEAEAAARSESAAAAKQSAKDAKRLAKRAKHLAAAAKHDAKEAKARLEASEDAKDAREIAAGRRRAPRKKKPPAEATDPR